MTEGDLRECKTVMGEREREADAERERQNQGRGRHKRALAFLSLATASFPHRSPLFYGLTITMLDQALP